MDIKTQQLDQGPQSFRLGAILEPLKESLDSLNCFLDSQIERFEPEVQDLVRYSLKHKGKRLRSMLVFYSAWKGDNVVSEDLVKIAAIIELSHLASLVHDDILDGAAIRHNMATVSNEYGSKVAVLLGDALFSHALVLASEFKGGDVCFAIARSIRRMCAGEIKQTFDAAKGVYSLRDYYSVIDFKTAELFYVSCLLGARLGGFEEGYVEAVACFGRNLGIAYQIYDDLLDILGNENAVGKTLGTDFVNGKYTLPILILIKKLSSSEWLTFLEGIKKGAVSAQDLRSLLIQHGVFSDAFALLSQKLEEAKGAIADYEYLPSFSYLIKVQELVFYESKRLEALCVSLT